MSTAFSSTQPLLSAQAVARLFSVSPKTVKTWARSGELRSLRVGGAPRFRVEDLQEFVDACARKRAAVTA